MDGQDSIDGNYAYRFNGFSVVLGTPYYLVGVGRMTLSDGKASGRQTSSTTAMAGMGEAQETETLTFEGTFESDGEGGYTATLTFDEVPGLTGSFELIPVDANRLWLISTAASLLPKNTPADEVVTGEAIRIA